MHSAKKGNHQIRHAGDGVCVLDENGLTYTGTDDGEEIQKFFPLEKIYRLLFGARKILKYTKERKFTILFPRIEEAVLCGIPQVFY